MQLRLHGSPDHRYERQIVVLDSQIAPDVGRIEGARCNDGFEVVKDAVAMAQDLDTALRFGFGFRYLAAGPMLQRDHAGLDVHCAAAATMYPTLCNASEPSQVLKNHVAQGRWGMKTGGGIFD